MGIYEFDECFRNDVKLSKKQYWKAIRKKADTLAAAKELKQSALFLGIFQALEAVMRLRSGFLTPFQRIKYRILLHIVTKSYMK